ncbi:MAG: hypothetical protein PWP45_1656 [Tepidanaerobacteraceae bacterium]|nr:hypothetical protein [Tepidanaerobacteraceae bacterium]
MITIQAKLTFPSEEDDKGRRGDFSGRKSRRTRHNFSYRSPLEKLKILAQRKGIQVIEVNPAYTSVIGMQSLGSEPGKALIPY